MSIIGVIKGDTRCSGYGSNGYKQGSTEHAVRYWLRTCYERFKDHQYTSGMAGNTQQVSGVLLIQDPIGPHGFHVLGVATGGLQISYKSPASTIAFWQTRELLETVCQDLARIRRWQAALVWLQLTP